MKAPPAPRLRTRRRTDPALTFSKLRDVVSGHCGIVTEVQRLQLREPGFQDAFMYGANLETATVLGFDLFRRQRGNYAEIWQEGAEGRNGHRVAYDRTRAFVRAVGEALERYACTTYDPGMFVTATGDELGDAAVDVTSFQLPTTEEYAHPRLDDYAAYDSSRPMRWAWAWSLRDETWRLVPAQLCYLMYNLVEGERFMMQSTSTGWAIHHTFEEAVQSGLREVVERDSFFLHWLNRMPMPRLDLDTVEDRAVQRFASQMAESGADLRVLVTTTDFGIPSFAALVTDRREGHPAFVMTLGAHTDPVRGVRQAVEEAAMMHLDVTYRVRTGRAAAPERMEDVDLMSHHGEYYLKHENLKHVEWMLRDDMPRLRLDELPAFDSGGDVWAEVQHMRARIAAAGHDTLFVDTTPPDLREAGWCAAKTMVPGSVRHEYGHGIRYLACPRVFEAPVKMGRRERPATLAELNADAHPYS